MDTAAAINPKYHYNSTRHSNIIIKYGSSIIRQLHCHTIILCSNSLYFDKMLNPANGFKESKQAEIYLKGDDVTAFEAWMMHIYGLDYIGAQTDDHDWALHLNVAEVADKYEAKELEKTAFDRFSRLVRNETDLDSIMALIEVLAQRDYAKETLEELREDLLDKHLVSLIKHPKFRSTLEADVTTLWDYVDRIVPPHMLIEKEYFTCKRCDVTMFREPGELQGWNCPECACFYSKGLDNEVKSCWVKKADHKVSVAEGVKKRETDATTSGSSKRAKRTVGSSILGG